MNATALRRFGADLSWPAPPRWLAPVLPVLVLAAGLAALPVPARRTVEHLQLQGTFQRLGPEAVRRALAPNLSRALLEIDIDVVRRDLAALPWAARVRVERRWPATLEVRVWERSPFARWNDAALLDRDGEVFQPAADEIPDGLPRLSGPPGTEAVVMATFQHLADRLADTPLALSGLRLDARGDWTVFGGPGVELRLGREAPEQRLPIITGALLPQLATRLAEVAYVDLRYSNGFAVGWRDPGPARPSAASPARTP